METENNYIEALNMIINVSIFVRSSIFQPFNFKIFGQSTNAYLNIKWIRLFFYVIAQCYIPLPLLSFTV